MAITATGSLLFLYVIYCTIMYDRCYLISRYNNATLWLPATWQAVSHRPRVVAAVNEPSLMQTLTSPIGLTVLPPRRYTDTLTD